MHMEKGGGRGGLWKLRPEAGVFLKTYVLYKNLTATRWRTDPSTILTG